MGGTYKDRNKSKGEEKPKGKGVDWKSQRRENARKATKAEIKIAKREQGESW